MGVARWQPSRSNRRYRGASRDSQKEGASLIGGPFFVGAPPVRLAAPLRAELFVTLSLHRCGPSGLQVDAPGKRLELRVGLLHGPQPGFDGFVLGLADHPPGA